MPPDWLETLAVVSLSLAGLSVIIIIVDIRGRGYRQPMGVMEWVWPITALYLGPFGLWFYWRVGRSASPKFIAEHGRREHPYWVRVAVSSTHCGGGCTLGDVLAETMIFAFGLSLFGATIWASYVLDFTFALLFGIAFQFFAIRAMSSDPTRVLLRRAAKADFWSLTAFEVGLFTWMGLMFFVFFTDPHLEANSAVFWFLMQIGMAIGLATSYPMNRLLIARGVKEVM
ncbi:MAG: DUF4396 domain-containing protein [Actinomycetota bacterium]